MQFGPMNIGLMLPCGFPYMKHIVTLILSKDGYHQPHHPALIQTASQILVDVLVSVNGKVTRQITHWCTVRVS